MGRHEHYYQPRVVPCECGSRDAYWHGPEDGAREYCCDDCWKRRQRRREKTNGIDRRERE
jgi:hypothetical protein